MRGVWIRKRGKTNSVRMAHVTLGGWDSSEDTQKVSSFANPTVRALFSTVDNLRSYFQLLKTVFDEGDFASRPQDVYNCDETVVDMNKSSQKVVMPRRFKSSHSRQVTSSEHVTLHCCVNATGTAIPPFIIYKSSFPGGSYTSGGPDGALYGKQQTGFMDSELFVKWFSKLFLPHARPTPENSVLLLVGHSSHCSAEVIKMAKENNVILLALAPHTTHLCQPLDVAVYKSFKVHLSKLVKLGQAVRGDLWISKSNVARMLKQPFEASMSIQNIKSGFRKCGIYTFNPNAIDKTQLFRNKLIPNEDVDLSLPPQEQNASDDVPNNSDLLNSDNSVEMHDNLDHPNSDVPETIQTSSIELTSLSSEGTLGNVVLEIPCPSTVEVGTPIPSANEALEDTNLSFDIEDFINFQSSPIDPPPEFSFSELDIQLNIDSPNTVITHPSFAQKISNQVNDQPITIKVFSKFSSLCSPNVDDGSICLEKTMSEVGTQTEEEHCARKLPTTNPLVTHGLISEHLADIFYLPDEKILSGQKRPLRIKSKARVMTADETIEDLKKQEEELKLKAARKEERLAAKRNKSAKVGQCSRTTKEIGTKKCNKKTKGSSTSVVNQSILSQPSGSKSGEKKKSARFAGNKEDNNCYKCEVNFYDVSNVNQKKWVGCETLRCPHWCCSECLTPGFNYKDEYYCNYCTNSDSD